MSLLRAHFCREPNERFPSGAADIGSGLCTFISMKTKKLTEVLERIEAWPPEAQDELADFALDLDAAFRSVEYKPTPEEFAGIIRGLSDAAEGRFATPQQVEAAFAKFMTVSATSVRFDEHTMWVDLADGRTLGVPLTWFPRLLRATPAERQQVELSRVGLHWETLDEDISVVNLLSGHAEPNRAARRSTKLDALADEALAEHRAGRSREL
jgi:hypothetical protein